MSKQFESYCENEGITRHFAAPYSPQQNGMVERRNRTVVGEKFFEREKDASVLVGRSSQALGLYLEPTTYMVFVSTDSLRSVDWGKTKHMTYTRIWLRAHTKIPSVFTKKLDDRSKAVIHLGKEPGTKAYRLYDPDNNTVHICWKN